MACLRSYKMKFHCCTASQQKVFLKQDHYMQYISCPAMSTAASSLSVLTECGHLTPAVQANTPSVILVLIKSRMEKRKRSNL